MSGVKIPIDRLAHIASDNTNQILHQSHATHYCTVCGYAGKRPLMHARVLHSRALLLYFTPPHAPTAASNHTTRTGERRACYKQSSVPIACPSGAAPSQQGAWQQSHATLSRAKRYRNTRCWPPAQPTLPRIPATRRN